jgi:hypothetical protein
MNNMLFMYTSVFNHKLWDISEMDFPTSLTGFKEFCMSHKATVKRIKNRRRR